ncbi:hypothetical protein LSH36_184g04002 [Paralvinella palmiformis]|uniref:Uncharacterized protein n=1 Tax=Paralvinella palmiformis TaxID=53620 RepID=A0AAD9JR18_9ANNE|nr:hypothetical protein LSH36_184g04002 [Paralvinella palmiformis]
MADVTELKDMIMSFRVSELQVLLGFAGRNKSGRKQELLSRCLLLIEKGCSTAIHIKIKDLYRRRFPANKPGISPTKAAVMAVGDPVSDSISSTKRGYNPYGGTLPYGAGGALDFSTKHGIASSTASPPSQVPVHPDVRFKRLPFYDILGELLKPSSLVPRGQTRFQENFFVFHLTPQQAQDVAMSRDTHISGRVDYTVQIQLRFCLLETSCEQEDSFPPSICVRVNGKMAPLPNPIPTNKPGVEPKRPSRPVNITTICRISPTVPNHINISWASELGRSYCVAVYLVRRLTSDILLQRLKQTGTRHPDHTRALIKEKLSQDPDSEIVTSSLRVSLQCPLGKMRMKIPARASTCTHLQCFDAPMYLQMNEKKPTWICPVCDKPAEFDKLFIDGLFTEILQSGIDFKEIKCTEDGMWHPLHEKEDKNDSHSPVIQSIEDSPNPTKQEGSVTCSGNDVIDLTETDDEDDVTMAVSVPDSNSSVGSPSSPSSTTSSSENAHSLSSPSVISLAPTTSAASGSSVPSLIPSRCVSPPVISLDTPPRLSVSPLSLPRSPRRTPHSNPRYSPYASPLVSPGTLSPAGRTVSSAASSTSTPLHHRGVSPTPSPPPAHSNVSSLSLSSLMAPPSTSSAYGSHPFYNPMFGNHLESMSDTDLDDILTSFASSGSAYPMSLMSSGMYNPYGGPSIPYSLASQMSFADPASAKDSLSSLYGRGLNSNRSTTTRSGTAAAATSNSGSSATMTASATSPSGSPSSHFGR